MAAGAAQDKPLEAIMIAIYTRNDDGSITYQGEQAWDSRDQVLQHFFRDDQPASSEKMEGWPHSIVTWHGDIGFGEE